ncbi:MAG: site-specific DNA-methyltransferase [bacterium]
MLSDANSGLTPQTLWTAEEVGTNDHAKKALIQMFSDGKLFDTPKPETLLQRIIHIAASKGDWVLDSFLGSGTTAAVAHKMGRKWIGIELGDHCHTHCLPRLKKVVDGSDLGGISKSVNWQGGGGFKYYYLAPSLLKKDKYGNWIIEERYNADMLAAAMAKHESFKYCPDEQIYWKQGKSTEKDFIFTTTQFITVEILDDIHEQMQPEESLLICCTSFQEDCKNRHTNINVKKIPNMLLGRCEFGKEDYSLHIINIPSMSTDAETPEIASSGPAFERDPAKEKKKTSRKQMSICD